MNYYIIAGEASGDLHGSNLMKGLKKTDPKAKFRFWGGDLMKAQGGELVMHYQDLAIMGVLEVVQNLGKIRKNLKYCRQDLEAYKPDVLILIDYAGFNLRIAKFARGIGFRIFYYISPKIWAWKQSRIHKIKKYVDRMFVILPFEVDYYKSFDFQVEYEGNPVVDAVEGKIRTIGDRGSFLSEHRLPDKPIIGLMPGSRKQEIRYILPVMLEAVKYYADYQFLMACSPSVEAGFYKEFVKDQDITLLYGQAYPILKHADAAMIASGTATLEAALLKVPEVVCYYVNPVSYFIGSRFVNVKFISLVNLIMDREVVKELLQSDLKAEHVREELDRILFDAEYRNNMLLAFDNLKKRVGTPGVSERVAGNMYRILTA